MPFVTLKIRPNYFNVLYTDWFYAFCHSQNKAQIILMCYKYLIKHL